MVLSSSSTSGQMNSPKMLSVVEGGACRLGLFVFI